MPVAASSHYRQSYTKTTLGFWLYLMTDCVLFASLFATFAVLRNGTADGPSGRDIFDLNVVFIETIILLVSSLTSGLAIVALKEKSKRYVMLSLVATFLLGLAFISIELYDFWQLFREGYGWQASAFLSSYFTLVGTHGVHILIGLIWLVVLIVFLLRHGITSRFDKRLSLFVMFWHFLDVIWIFIFTFVYLIGVTV